MPNPYGALTTRDFAQLQQTQGIPQFRLRQQHALAHEAASAREQRLARGIYGRDAQAQIARQVRYLIAQSEQLAPEGEVREVEIRPGVTIPFTPQELLTLQRDQNFARRTLRSVLRRNPSDRDIIQFQNKIALQFPNLEQEVLQGAEQTFRAQEHPFGAADPSQLRRLERNERQDRRALERLLLEQAQMEPSNPRLPGVRRAINQLQQSLGTIPFERLRVEAQLQSPQDQAAFWAQQVQQLRQAPFSPTALQRLQQVQEAARTAQVQEQLSQLLQQQGITTFENADALLSQVAAPHNLSPTALESLRAPLRRYFETEADVEVNASTLRDDEKRQTLRRVGAEGEILELQRRGVRVAPLTPEHREAEELLRQSIDRTGRRAQQGEERLRQIEGALPSSEEGRAQWSRAAAMLPEQDWRQLVQAQFDPAFEDLEQRLLAKAERSWQRKVLPSIQAQYGAMGLQGTPAMYSGISHRQEEYERDVQDKVAQLRADQWKEARQAAAMQIQADISRAKAHEGLGETAHRQRLGLEQVAQPAAAQAATQEGLAMAGMGQLAQQVQQQAQNELTARQRAFEEEVALPSEVLATEEAITRGLQLPTTTSMVLMPNIPTPPSAINALGGTLAEMMRPTVGGHAHGGRVKRRFNDGGVPSWGQLQSQVPLDPYAAQQQQVAQDLSNYQFNRQSNLLAHIGPALLGAAPGEVHTALADALKQHHKDEEQAAVNSLGFKAKSAEIYDAMHKSLLMQKHFLADYEAKKAANAEQKRYHDLLHAQHHEANQVKLATSATALQKGIEEEKARIRSALALENTLDELEQVYGRLGTGSVAGGMADSGHDLTAALLGIGSREDVALSRGLNKKAVMETQQALSGLPKTKATLEYIEQGGPTLKAPVSVNLQRIRQARGHPKMALEHATQRLQDYGLSADQIKAYMTSMKQALSADQAQTASRAEGTKAALQARLQARQAEIDSLSQSIGG